MNRCFLGICILVLFLACGLWGAKAMTAFHTPLLSTLEQAAEIALDGDLNVANKLTKEVQKTWSHHWDRVAILADHTPMDEIDSHFSRLDAYARSGNRADFAACCMQLSTLLSANAEAHALTWKNLL